MDHNVRTSADFAQIVQQVETLDDLIRQEAIKIVVMAKTMRQQVNSINEKYFDIAAKKFETINKKKCVFEAPDRWLPFLPYNNEQ